MDVAIKLSIILDILEVLQSNSQTVQARGGEMSIILSQNSRNVLSTQACWLRKPVYLQSLFYLPIEFSSF